MTAVNQEDVTAAYDTARRFAEREIAPYINAWEETATFPRALYKKAADAGLMGLGYPEELGGTPAPFAMRNAVSIALARFGTSGGVLASLFSCNIGLPPVLRHGSAALQQQIIPPVLRGEQIAALAITEPGGGSDVARITTRAELVQGRDGEQYYLVNGAKTFITSGVRADFVTTAVRTGPVPFDGGGHAGISLLVVEKGTPGFTVDRSLKKMGWHCSDTAELSYVDVRVPVANLVGAENSGFGQIADQFVVERIALAVHGYGIAARALDLTAAHCRDRQTFGRPLIANQTVQHTLVEMHRQVEVARTYARQVAARHDAGEFVVAEACLAKQTAVDCATYVCDRAVQLHGGTGYMHGTEVERHYRDARILPIGGGADEVLRDLTAKLLGYTAASPRQDTE